MDFISFIKLTLASPGQIKFRKVLSRLSVLVEQVKLFALAKLTIRLKSMYVLVYLRIQFGAEFMIKILP